MRKQERLGDINEWDRMDALSEVAPEGPLAREAEQFTGFYARYSRVLDDGERGGQRVLLSPNVDFYCSRMVEGEGIKRFDYEGYLIFPKNVRGNNLKEMYFFFKNTREEDDAHRIKVDINEGVAVDLDTEESFENHELITTLLKTSENALNPILNARVDRLRRIRNTALTIGALAGAALGGYIGYEYIYLKPHEEAVRRAQAARKIFDNSHYILPGTPTQSTPVAVKALPKTQFYHIPKHARNDNFINARRFSIREDSCREFGVKFLPGENIVLAQSGSNGYQNDPFAAGFDSGGKLYVCSVNQTNSNSSVNFDVALQIR